MKKLFLQKYKNNGIQFILLLIVSLLLCFLMGNEIGFFGAMISIFGFAPFAAYYLYAYFSYQKKTVGMVPQEGVIANWQLAGRRSYRGSVSIKMDDQEYESSAVFTAHEAREMVGKKVSYFILDDTLLICDILN